MMCDTFVAVPTATADGSVVFGKNSDREPDEAHELVTVGAAEHSERGTLRCTHITIPQAVHTNGVLLAKPYWIWGAEMGVNDRGVVIGNEALFNKGTREEHPGLIGMDLLRLGLERADSAAEAVHVMAELLGRHGQSGQAGHTHDFQYDNSFIAADHTEAFVLETMGREWVARRVVDIASISNGLTTRNQWDMASVGVTDGIDVARRYSEPIFTRFADAVGRQCRTQDALTERHGQVVVADALAALRDHSDQGPDWTPATSVIGQDVCMHAGFGPVRSSQTTGSLAAHITADGVTVWVTGTAAPCTSVFKPVWVDSGLPDLGRAPRGYFDPETLWWRHELLHRATLADYAHRHAEYAAERDRIESDLLAQVPAVTAPLASRRDYTRNAFATVADHETRWWERIRDHAGPSVPTRITARRPLPAGLAVVRPPGADAAAGRSGSGGLRYACGAGDSYDVALSVDCCGRKGASQRRLGARGDPAAG